MKTKRRTFAVLFLFALLSPVVALGILSALAQQTSPPGLVADALADCPSSPNCVCSESASPDHQVPPISFRSDSTSAMREMTRVLTQMPRTELVTESGQYLHVVFRSALFRFPDDVEVRLDENAGVLHIRSASRTGHSDLGVNRNRVEQIRKVFEQSNAAD